MPSPIRRLGSLRALPAGERRIALRAHWALPLTALGLHVVPYRWLADRVARTARRADADPMLGTCVVTRSLDRASRTFPWASCLAIALVAEWLLRQLGHPAERHIGVEASGLGAGALKAHAWVTAYGDVVVGGADAPEVYRPLTSAGGA